MKTTFILGLSEQTNLWSLDLLEDSLLVFPVTGRRVAESKVERKICTYAHAAVVAGRRI
jgi:hypothetical protein